LTLLIERKEYSNNSASVNVAGVLINPLNGNKIPFKTLCTIDTGFSDGIFLPHMFIHEIESTGAVLREKNTILADGTEINVKICQGYLQKIDDCALDYEKEVIVVMYEKTLGELLGMNALQYFLVTLNGPEQWFTIQEVPFLHQLF
jgi:predicted aspartyl protease